MRLLPLLVFAPFFAGCHSGEPDHAAVEEVVEPTPVDLSTWTGEDIDLPPGFAPDMPAGRETLLFAPGWRKPGGDDHWSYVLLMEVEESGDDAAKLEDLFEQYFDGLIGAVSDGKPFEVPDDPADVTVREEGQGRYSGVVKTYDAFGTGDELTLHLLVDVEPSSDTTTVLRVLASPRSPDATEVWSSMQQAIDSLSFD